MSVEIRYMTEGDCRCPGPYGPDEEPTCRHWWECDYGPVSRFDIRNPAPLIITGRDWVHDVFKQGGQRRSHGRVHTISVVPYPNDQGDIDENSPIRMFHRIDFRGRSWTWELEPAHWAEKPGRDNNAHLPIYLGRWPD